MEMKTNNNNKITEFTMIVRSLINTAIFYVAFTFGNVRRLDLNGKFIYLWQNAKGDVHYSFNIFEKEYYTTSAIKLGNVLTQHFGVEVEVVNNRKEHLKKMIGATVGLNKALSDSNRYNYFENLSQEEQNLSIPNNLNFNPIKKEQLLGMLDSKPNNSALIINQNQFQTPQHYLHDQEKLYNGTIQLSTFYLEAHLGTTYIKLDDLPIIHREKFVPNTNTAFFTDINGLNNKNKFIPTPYMVYPYNLCEPNQSFIILFILFMTKNDIHQAFKILLWLTETYRLNKLPFALVLHSQEDVYMKLFFEELLEPFFHDFQCEKIENEAIEAKILASNLDEKYIYNFHNISSPSILGEASYELTNKLIHKDSNKINKKSITTVANIVISSTSRYIPMINEDVLCSIVEIDSNIDALCKCEYINIRPNKNTIAKYIKNDISNFVSILRTLDLQALNNAYPVLNQNIPNNLLDGNTDATMVIDRIIRDKDITPFKSIARTKAEEKLVQEMEDNFSQNRVDKAHLLDYFELLFGKSIYKSNRALIDALKKDFSCASEPFDNLKTHVRKGRAYYFL